MCPARIAVPTVAPGLAPYRHQPTTLGSSGTSSSPSGVVPTGMIGACAWIFGISMRFGEMMSATALGAMCVGTTPLWTLGACALLAPQYGEVTQVMPASATVSSAAIAHANGAQ